ncbi:MAG: hypothetical protein AN488_01115 [Anabaena sp. WA113]|jgi:superfamily II DNA or RNA helicase|nr:MAG: hypothetical protein AN488_01115 [Anabaena sp. WA113]
MTYSLFEIPSENGNYADVVWADPSNSDRNAYTHIAYVIETTDTENNVLDRRGIRFKNLRHWKTINEKFPTLVSRIKENHTYYAGESVLAEDDIKPRYHIQTVLRLGALELLANIYSGRITASDKDPFPHQLAVQQYVKTHESRIKRILIADEVGLGKTIEVGLILRDKLISQKDDFRCLYLTSGGLTEDVKEKLRSVIKDSGDESIISVVDSFREYGDSISQKGIRIASMHAARLYLEDKSKKQLPKGVKPNIIIIDECHHCASNDDLIGKSVSGKNQDKETANTTQAYKAAYQMIAGKFWNDSEPPDLVILMSATPFRSSDQFTNLLRLLTHQTVLTNAYAKDIGKQELLAAISTEDSPVTVIWRQQDEIRNWSDERLFPKLTIVRPHREGEPTLEKTNEEYLSTLEKIKRTVQRIYRDHNDSFGGFATAHLETRLTSSSLAGACWLFRWCVRHHPKWQNEKMYKADTSDDTKQLRKLIREISKRLAEFDENRDNYAKDIIFPSDGNFSFGSKHLGEGSIPRIYEFQKTILDKVKQKNNDDDDDPDLEATIEEILEVSELALNLLSSGKSVENAKLNWLRAMLEAHPDSRFLVFTEVLQTTAIIKATFGKESESLTGEMSSEQRKEVVQKFYDRNKNCRILVATSAADEGLDFQVANKVVHWDISPDPAILMQRNGRVARLGQISDVTAYYLILEGTLAEKRDTALLDRLIKAGVKDPRMQLKILGQLDAKQQEKIINAVDDGADKGNVDQILKAAQQYSDLMEKELRKLNENEQLKPQWVLDRKKLLKRLKIWHDLKVTEYDFYRHKLTFETKEWQRPVFGEEKTEMESAVSDVLAIQHFKGKKDRFNFDPEFSLFSQEKNLNGLAGLLPWYIKESEGATKEHQPMIGYDPIGSLAESLARQRQADFIAVSAQKLYEDARFSNFQGCSYLLFVTHPLRELEKNKSLDSAKYLTYYTFTTDFSRPINPDGASANEVHEMITFLEEQIVQGVVSLSYDEIFQVKSDGKDISKWVLDSFSMGGHDFLDEESTYLVPIPVALIAIINERLEVKEYSVQA